MSLFYAKPAYIENIMDSLQDLDISGQMYSIFIKYEYMVFYIVSSCCRLGAKHSA